MVEKEMNNLMIPKSSLLAKLPILFIGIGIAALVYWSTLFQLDQGRAIFGYLFSFVSVLTLLLGSLIFILIQHVTRAGWSVVIRRVPETVVYLFPIFILLFLPIAFFRHEIFPWTHVEHLDAILEKKQG